MIGTFKKGSALPQNTNPIKTELGPWATLQKGYSIVVPTRHIIILKQIVNSFRKIC
jgi:hypothetical protein